MKTKFIKTGLLIALSAIIFTSCQKEDLIELAPAPTQQKVSLKQIASSQQFAKVYQQMEAKYIAQNPSLGAEFILPFFTADGFGIARDIDYEWDCESYPPWCSGTIVSGQLAYFDTELGPKDFFRRNPDGTVTVKINSKIADAYYADYTPNPDNVFMGTNTNLNMTYTGSVESFTYEDWDTHELITVYYIDYYGNNRGAVSFHGNGKVRQGNTGPFKTLVSRWVANPGWTQLNWGFTLN